MKKNQVAIGNAYEAVVNRRKGERREFFAIVLGGRRSMTPEGELKNEAPARAYSTISVFSTAVTP